MSLPIRSAPLSRSRQRNIRNLSTLRGQLARTEFAATSGRKHERLSDDPAIWTSVSRLAEQLDDQDTWESNAGKAVQLFDSMDAALEEGTRIMREARAIGVRMATGSMSADDRIMAAGDVRGKFDALLKEANTESAGRYVFAGTRYDQQAFDATGTYQGTSDVPSTLLSNTESVDIGVDGSTTFGISLTALDDLATAMESGDQAAVEATLGDLDTAVKSLIERRTRLGGDHRSALDTQVLVESMRTNIQSALDGELAADPFETFRQLSQIRTSYEANIAVTASSQQMRGLMQYLQ